MNDLIFEIVKFIGLRLGCFNLIKSFEPGLKDFDNIKAISIFENQKKNPRSYATEKKRYKRYKRGKVERK